MKGHRTATEGWIRDGETQITRFRVMDTLVHAVDCDDTERQLRRFLEDGKQHQVITVNIDFLRMAHAMPAFSRLINDADLVVADGKPVVWMAQYLGLRSAGRVTGQDIIEMSARISASSGASLFLLGGEAAVVESARSELTRRLPDLVCNAYSPPIAEYPFSAEIEAEILGRLREAQPDILLVAFGCPKQEYWIRDHLAELGIPVCVGIGGSFNFVAGTIPRAPSVLQGLGFEWFYRLWREPRRLWRRYLRDDLPFVLRLTAMEVGHRTGFVRRPILQAIVGEQS